MITKNEENEKLTWIQLCKDSPYFVDEKGDNWTPIGQNDAIIWPDLEGLFKRKNIKAVEGYFAFLAAHGVNCLRIMLEYCQTENRYFERPAGRFQPNMVQLWDDLFELCEKYKLRILLTPFDTFWMDKRWKYHPYNVANNGPCKRKSQWLTSPETLEAIKNRLTFVTERWGSSGVLFAWDLWNEINPAHALGKTDGLYEFVTELSVHLSTREKQLYGKTHPQTVSVFAPLIERYQMKDLIFRHPELDFASTHFYETGTINNPKNTIDAAISTGKMVRDALLNLPPERPFFDSEHGPIDHYRKKQNLPESFDNQYFLNMQWAHVASGAVGGGMRWPYRQPHVLSFGMRRAQQNLTEFTRLINWKIFKRKNLNSEIKVSDSKFAAFGCGDKNQAIVWLLKKEKIGRNKIFQPNSMLVSFSIQIPGLEAGLYKIHVWDTLLGEIEVVKVENVIQLEINLKIRVNNIAIAIVKTS
ncbi:hypothetical protein [Dyadobacter frigoris]|uniref:Glycoside hydrolase family 5 domain-containing protein n=1 Tax=Dyadobacter frigoris TaxID=2576211 RepID=A0A4U6D2C0_9BACT|nr:hypothetical protein [Dyadobacter frigoris]TKT90445.1 hypothetical protein FDK13_19080 [Dyadobacter frigoris]GLU51429.1 hypothetical protein Dfri01_08900 [Dyadobacter frigoris]